MQTSNFIKYPFATAGDKTEISEATSSSGEVSLQQGYTTSYSTDPQAGGKYIERAPFNYILNYYTSEIQTLQINGINEVSNTILTTTGYPKGARCVVWVDVSTGKLNRNGSSSSLCITMPVISMVDSNTTDPYSSGALNTKWFLDDGMQVGQIKVCQTNAGVPDGYLDLAPDNTTPSYNKADYTRINELLGTSASSTFHYFQSTSTTTFTIINPRGRFPRVWSNGSTIDSGRTFTTLQAEALPNITGYLGWSSSPQSGSSTSCLTRIYGNGGAFGGSGNSGVSFSASNSSSVYQSGAQVTPYNFCQKMYIKI